MDQVVSLVINGGGYSHSVEKVSCIVSGESGEVLNTMRRMSILVKVSFWDSIGTWTLDSGLSIIYRLPTLCG